MKSFLLVVLCAGFASASISETGSHMSKRAWISKAALLLGQGYSTSEVEARAFRSREEILEELMSRDDFAEAVLGFNLYFLGLRPARIVGSTEKGVKHYDQAVYLYPSATRSARAFLDGKGDYLSLLDFEQPWYVEPLLGVSDEDRAKLGERGRKQINAVIAEAEAKGDQADPKYFCWQLEHIEFANVIYSMGFGRSIRDPIEVYWDDMCFHEVRSPSEVVPYMKKIRARLEQLLLAIPELKAEAYRPRSLRDIREMFPNDWGLAPYHKIFPMRFWDHFQNSSTNFSRKRAAYILSRYFCDDLTPVNVEVPSVHAEKSAHASDTTCYACHYKMDPMAGFFWSHGSEGYDFSKREFLVLDDEVKIKTEDYHKNWAAPGGGWNIGYVRSPGDMVQGENLEDLFGIIRESGEVKACLVKRMSEYFVGKELTFDPGYIASLAGLFTSSQNSSEGFKAALKKLMLDNTFSIDDPAPDRCYDFPAGASRADRPPCRVASVLEKNCVDCHKSVLVNGGIDLSRWVETGKGRSFPHLGFDGTQRAPEDSFEAMLASITSASSKRCIPPWESISNADREALFLWLNDMLTQRTEAVQ